MFNEPHNSEQEIEDVLGGAAEDVQSSDEELRSRDWEQELENIIGGAAEAVFESNDEEVEAELRSWGEDPGAVAEEVRSVLLDAADRYEREDRVRHRVRIRAASRSAGRGPRLPS